MRRIGVAAALLLLAAAVFTALGAAAPRGKLLRTAAPVPLPKPKPKPAKPKLAAASVGGQEPQALGDRREVRLPPFGFIDVRGNNDGYDVQVAQRFAQLAFGARRR
jgi:hypothetical protein